MRIIAGDHRGRSISTPQGLGTRPTSDKARQALFNVLGHAVWAPPLPGARVLDMFAGSGALGLEALSRGAEFAAFIDMAPAAVTALSKNITSLRLDARAQVLKRHAGRLGNWSGVPFALVFLDPPYHKGLVAPALEGLARGGWLSPAATLAVEHGAEEVLVTPDFMGELDQRTWGAATVSFLRYLG